MQTVFITACIILGAAVIALDVLGLLERVPRWLSYLNAALHSALIISLFFAGAELSHTALVMMSSAALITLSSYIKYRRRRRADRDV
ncbi:MAG: hypothetical protein IJW48_05890 [Clostridia bacterium]|nr:hypothetical protein [Clostridia bacterium]MBQ7363959.1 hypothetical protein [Clostridia bacterium]